MDITYKVSPTFAKIHKDYSKFIFVMGPVASGKSSGMVFQIFFNAMKQKPDDKGIRHSRYAVIRATYPQLRSSTIKTFISWFKDKMEFVYSTPILGKLRYPLADGTSINMEIMFIAADDEQACERLRSWEFTGAWVNEAHEVPRYLVTILSERTNRFPAEKDGGAVNPQVLFDYNAVSTDHWLYKIAEEEKPLNCAFYRQPPAVIKNVDGRYTVNLEAENLENLAEDYYPTILSVATPEQISTDLMNNYGERKAGKPVYKDYSDEDHLAPTEIKPLRGIPVVIGLDQGLCFTDKVEVLTDSGWKYFKDVNKEIDKVLSKDITTGISSWCTIQNKIEEPHNGPMLRFSNNNVQFEVTSEHRIPYTTPDISTTRFAYAKDIAFKSKKYVGLTSSFEGTIIPDRAFVKLLGWYLSEGSIEKDTNRICIAQKHKDKRAILFEDLKELNLSINECDNGFRFSDKDLADKLRLCGEGAHNKTFLKEMYYWDKNSLLLFLDRFTLGDGYIRTRTNRSVEHVCYTSSKALRDDLQALAQLVGWSSSYDIVKPRQSFYFQEDRYITSTTDNYVVRFKKRASKAELHKAQWSTFDYTGTRYCLTVEHGTLYIRMNGRPSWSGNSPAATFTQIAMDGAVIVFDELTTIDCSLQEFAEEMLLPRIMAKYPYIRDNYICICDPATSQRSQNDAKSGIDILKEAGLNVRAAKTNVPTDRRESVIHYLRLKNKFKLSPNCQALRKGFISEYKYEEARTLSGILYKEKPAKNEYSHVHDALQYAMLEYYFAKKRKKFRKVASNYKAASTIGGY